MITASRELGSAEGVVAAPEGAACYAALKILLEDGTSKPQEKTVIFNPGSGLKYLECVFREKRERPRGSAGSPTGEGPRAMLDGPSRIEPDAGRRRGATSAVLLKPPVALQLKNQAAAMGWRLRPRAGSNHSIGAARSPKSGQRSESRILRNSLARAMRLFTVPSARPSLRAISS
jgi:hypothetical protein